MLMLCFIKSWAAWSRKMKETFYIAVQFIMLHAFEADMAETITLGFDGYMGFPGGMSNELL